MKTILWQMKQLTSEAKATASASQLRRMLLDSKAVRGDDLVVEDLQLPGGRARADVAVIREGIDGFLIMPSTDRMGRLARQVHEYDRFFRHSSIVTVPGHLERIEELLPTNWGIWIALGEGRTLRLRCLRRASANWRRSAEHIARLLTREECLSELEASRSFSGTETRSTAELIKKVGLVRPLPELEAYLRDCLLARWGVQRGARDPNEVDFVPAADYDFGEQGGGEPVLSLGHLARAGLSTAGRY